MIRVPEIQEQPDTLINTPREGRPASSHLPWHIDEIRYVRKRHGQVSTAEIAEVLGRSVSSVSSKAARMRLGSAEVSRSPWTPADNDRLSQVYMMEGFSGVKRKFPERSEASLRSAIKDRELKTLVDGRVASTKRWSEGCPFREQLEANINKRPLPDIAEDMGVNAGVLYKTALRLGLAEATATGAWSDAETTHLKSNLKDKTLWEIACDLSRNVNSVKHQLRVLAKTEPGCAPVSSQREAPGA